MEHLPNRHRPVGHPSRGPCSACFSPWPSGANAAAPASSAPQPLFKVLTQVDPPPELHSATDLRWAGAETVYLAMGGLSIRHLAAVAITVTLAAFARSQHPARPRRSTAATSPANDWLIDQDDPALGIDPSC